jgi:hypothetical protein
MDGTAVIHQKMALRIARHSQAHAVAGAEDVFAFEGLGGHPHERGHARQVRLREVYKSLLAAAFRTSRLAFKSQSLSHLFNYQL